MKKSKQNLTVNNFFWVVTFSLLVSCNQKNENIEADENDAYKIADSSDEGPKKQNQPPKNVEVKIFSLDSTNKSNAGFGYDILVDGNLYIHQPMIPAVAGDRAFQTREDAERVAGLVAYKIKNNIMPPAVGIKELDSLGVK